MDTAVPASVPAVRDTPTASAAPVAPVALEILRDIARGGLAALFVGIVLGGIGGRLVMRLAALLVPSADRMFTENGNRIGDITLVGTSFLIAFTGLAVAMILGVIWVVISPWLPRRRLVRSIAAMPIALAFGGPLLIEGFNPDFLILRRDVVVVASLVLLVVASAPAMVVADGWLDRHLPRPRAVLSPSALAYVVLAVLGGILGTFLVFQTSGAALGTLPVTIVAVGIATLVWWVERARGREEPSPRLTAAARAILAVGTTAGLVAFLPEVAVALGI